MPRPVHLPTPRTDALPGRAGAVLPNHPVHADPRPVARSMGVPAPNGPAPMPSPRINQDRRAEPGVLLVGIDPGVSGGLCWLGPSFLSKSPDAFHHRAIPMPDTLDDLWHELQDRVTDAEQEGWKVRVLLEQVGGFIGGGHRDPERGPGRENQAAAHTTFTFGENYGAIQGMLTALRHTHAVGLVYRTAVPKRWQGYVDIEPRQPGETSGKWKSRLAVLAHDLYPDVKFNKPQADAVLLCHVARHYWGELDDGSGQSGKAIPPRKARRRV